MKEIEKFIKDYEKWSLTSKHTKNSLYEYSSNKKIRDKIGKDYEQLLIGLEYIQNIISRNKKMLVTYDKSHTGTKYYYKFAGNIDIVMKNIILFVRKLVPYFV